jgi:hypothetical protein
MVDLLQQGAQWLADQQRRFAAQAVTYVRGADTAELLATVGSTTREQADEYGVLQRVEMRDYLVPAEDLVLAGQLTEPRSGDRIRETRDGRTFVYEVLAMAGEPPWRWSDPYRTTLRIHTKHVATEP